MEIKTYNGKSTTAAEGEIIFFIQSRGMHAGRPLLSPLANCWEVRTRRGIDFEICAIVFESRILETFIIGSVIPFIRLEDYKNIIFRIVANGANDTELLNQRYIQLRKLQELEAITAAKLATVRELRQTLSRAAMKRINIEL